MKRFAMTGMLMLTFALAFGQAPLRADPPAPAPWATRQALSQILTDDRLIDMRIANAYQLASITFGNAQGIDVEEVSPALRAQLDLAEGAGVVISSISAESGVAKAGLQAFDLVLKLDDEVITGTQKFHEVVGNLAGKTVQFGLLRKGRPATLPIELRKLAAYDLAKYPVALDFSLQLDSNQSTPQYRIGVTLSTADDTLRQQLRLADGEGLIVTDVVAESPAAKAGVQKHDVLVKLDGKRLTSVEEVNTQIQELKEREVALILYRAGQEVAVRVAAKLSEDVAHFYLGTVQDRFSPVVWKVLTAQPAPNGVHWTNGIVTQTATPAEAPAGVADQVAALRKQLDALQSSLSTLEASLKPAPAEKPAGK